jgi:acyl-CoA reductase-like NAD-dependent aldehyde dehydrogenase
VTRTEELRLGDGLLPETAIGPLIDADAFRKTQRYMEVARSAGEILSGGWPAGGGHRKGGWEVYEFYSETKVCSLDYSGRLQRAKIDDY